MGPGMEIDQLRYFLKVAEVGNFTKAAAESGISSLRSAVRFSGWKKNSGNPSSKEKRGHFR